MKKNRSQNTEKELSLRACPPWRAKRGNLALLLFTFLMLFIVPDLANAQTSEDDLKPVLKYEMDAELNGIRDTTEALADSIDSLRAAIDAIEIAGVEASDSGIIFETPFRLDTLTNGVYADINTNKIAIGLNTSKVTMTYPSAGIPLSVAGTSWGSSITNNSANWNTAYGWGDWNAYIDQSVKTTSSPTFANGTITADLTVGDTLFGATGTFTGNVGIGTTAPGAELHISKANGAGDVAAIIQNNATTNGETASLLFRTTTSANNDAMIVTERVSSGDANLHFYTNKATATVNRMTILNSGNVGIGTTSPGAALEIGDGAGNEAIKINAAVASQAGIQLWAAGTQKWNLYKAATTNNLELYNNGGTSSVNLVVEHATGNVGIGNTLPTEKLDVTGSGVFSDDLTVGDSLFMGSAQISEAELEILDGATVTTTQLNYVDATSSIQTQLNTKLATADVDDSLSANGIVSGHQTMNINRYGYAFVESYTAGEVIDNNKWCYMQSDGTMWLASNNDSTGRGLLVCSIDSVGVGETGTFSDEGLVNGWSPALIRGEPYYLTTNGEMSSTPPALPADLIRVGVAVGVARLKLGVKLQVLGGTP